MEWVLIAIVVLLVVWGVWTYNRLVTARNRYKNAFAQIDVQLTRRYDLIPNLVKVAERYMSHERDTLEAVIQARNQAMDRLKQVVGTPPTPRPCASCPAPSRGCPARWGGCSRCPRTIRT